MTLTHQPHDKFFKASLKERQIAIDFLKSHLPAEIYQRLDLNTLQLIDKSLSLPDLKEMHGDIVYQCQIDGQDGYIPILFLLEHLSTAPKHTAFYLLQGSVGLMADHLKAGHSTLPLVLPICVYHGKKSPYPHSTDIYDAFDDPALAKAILFQPFSLVDLTVLSEETIKQHGTAALMELLFQQYHTKDFIQALKQAANGGLLRLTITQTTAPYFTTVLEYIHSTGNPDQSVHELTEVLAKALPDKQEVMMSFAQQLEEKGFNKGMQQGMQQGMLASHQDVWQASKVETAMETAKKLLAARVDRAIVRSATGLTDTDLAHLADNTEE